MLVHPLGAGQFPADEFGGKCRMTQFILRAPWRRVYVICPPVPYPEKLTIAIFISYDGKPAICHTSPGKNGVPMIYREKACILPPVYFPGTLYCCPYSFLIISSLLPPLILEQWTDDKVWEYRFTGIGSHVTSQPHTWILYIGWQTLFSMLDTIFRSLSHI